MKCLSDLLVVRKYGQVFGTLMSVSWPSQWKNCIPILFRCVGICVGCDVDARGRVSSVSGNIDILFVSNGFEREGGDGVYQWSSEAYQVVCSVRTRDGINLRLVDRCNVGV